MKPISRFPLMALMLAVPAVVAAPAVGSATPGPLRDFRLPPAPTPSPSGTPQVQGPVDSEAPISTRPREIAPRETPAPVTAPTTAASPLPSQTPSQPDTRAPAVRPAPTQSAPRQRPPANIVPAAPPRAVEEPQTLPAGDAAESDLAAMPAEPENPVADTIAPPPPEAISAPAGSPIIANIRSLPAYVWWGIAAVLLAGMGAMMVRLWLRRKPAAASVPLIEPPLGKRPLADAPSGGASGGSAAAEAEAIEPALPDLPIQITAEASALSRSMMNAALSYRFDLRNLGKATLENVSIRADITTAHGKAPVADQVAHEDTELPFTSLMAAIKSGASQELKGDLRMPVSAIRLLTQGNAKLYVPLVRLRVDVAGFAPLIHTFVVGIRPAEKGGKLLPFRLDEMAQTYRLIGLRAVA